MWGSSSKSSACNKKTPCGECDFRLDADLKNILTKDKYNSVIAIINQLNEDGQLHQPPRFLSNETLIHCNGVVHAVWGPQGT